MSGKLYHCIPCAPQGDCIRPSSNYGSFITPDMWAQMGSEPQPKGTPVEQQRPLLFAATHIGKALSFAFPRGEDNLIVTATLEKNGELTEFAIVCNRHKTMEARLDAVIYAFSAEGFVDVPNAYQCVSLRAIPFSEAEVVLKPESVSDLMRVGLQVFSLDETFKGFGGFETLQKMTKSKDDEGLLAVAVELVKSGRMVWENRDRGISPSPHIEACFAPKTPVPQKPAGP